ncbi:MAG: hypothetical protein MR270_00845 [Erysipelotrichaceae bacterium]|nr:hypothetical protein [Erysipelotrichaceae bacterium]
MDKKRQIIDISIKNFFMLFAILLAIFIIKDLFFVFPLLSSLKQSEIEIYQLLSKTTFIDIFMDLDVVDIIDFKVISNCLVSFLSHLDSLKIFYLIVLAFFLFLFFIFIRYTLIENYLKHMGFIILFFVLKYILFGVSVLLFYNFTYMIQGGVFIGSILYILCALGELFFLSLWIIKFIVNITMDINGLKVNYY